MRNHPICLFFISVIFLTACGPKGNLTTIPTNTVGGDPILQNTPGPTGTQLADAWLDIFFTDPNAPRAKDYRGGPDEMLAAAIDASRLSVDVAAFSLNLWSIRDALLRAMHRGVVVRMVIESDNMDYEEIQQLQAAGIPIVTDQRESLMHNKFIVIDRLDVWTGSMNFTTSGAYRDNNNLIHIRSEQVAETYSTKFYAMFERNLFGADARSETSIPTVTIDGTLVETYFSPEDGIADHIKNLIMSATDSIYFLAYSFTANDLGEAIMQKASEGVTIAGVMDASQINQNQGTEFDAFMQAGLDVRRDGNGGLMHHKVIIIDHSIVISGSYNFSNSAENYNDENIVILYNAKAAELFLSEFQRIYSISTP